MHYFTFWGVGGDLPGLCQVDQSVEVMLYVVLASVLSDFPVEHCIIGEKFEGGSWWSMGGHVIFIEKEEEGAKIRTVACGTPDQRSRVPDLSYTKR